MNLKKLLFLFLFFSMFISAKAKEPEASYKLYGFVRSDWYLNSRQNVEALDGLFNILPKPREIVNGEDVNSYPNSEMLSVSSRLGFDFTGTPLFGAKTSAKIECDFAGITSSYYLIRIRQAYLKLNWEETELLVGQTWHPLYNNLQPITPALSVGTPFQSFNRSPQIRVKQNFTDNLSVLATASYQMQYLTQGPYSTAANPSGASASYMKNGLLPSLHVGLDFKSQNFLAGVGVDGKSLLINHVRLNSGAAVAYAAYTNKKFQVRAKSVLGQNMSEHLMIGGYGVNGTKKISDVLTVDTYTNFNTSTSWLSFAYGSKVQVGLYGGFSKNLGTTTDLVLTPKKFVAYGYGFYQGNQLLLDQLYRVAPHITYNLPNFKLGCEYEYTAAKYGNIDYKGLISDPDIVKNHRISATISYIF